MPKFQISPVLPFSLSFLCLILTASLSASEELPVNNPYGVHLIESSLNGWSLAQLEWAEHLIGPRGYIKTCIFGITEETTGTIQAKRDFIQEIYDRDLIPIIRMGGVHDATMAYWHKPFQDAPGDYSTIARAFASVVADLPRSDKAPLYVEIWNEPNLPVEWSGKVNLEEYGQFFVQVAEAIRAIGDDRIKILNGAFALSWTATEEMFSKVPESVYAFDVWATHPYPQNQPPWYNLADGTTLSEGLCIDSWILEIEVVDRYRDDKVPIMIVETGYDLGNSVFPELPVINEILRAEYISTAFRDYWTQEPRILAITPFLFCDRYWERFNWVHINSRTNPDGSPTRPYYQYTCVAALAKPTEPLGAINGKVTEKSTGTPLEGVQVLSIPIGSNDGAGVTAVTDSGGVYFLPKQEPGLYTVSFRLPVFSEVIQEGVEVKAGQNTVLTPGLVPGSLGTVVGTVRSGETGKGIHGVRVEFTPTGDFVETGRTGFFLLKDLPPVPGDIRASKEGYVQQSLRVVPKPDGMVYRDLRISSELIPEASNQLQNASFEQGLGEITIGGVALRWETLISGPFEVSDRYARGGIASQSIRAASESAVRQITHYGTAQPGRNYEATVWARGEDLGGEAMLVLCFTANSGARGQESVSEIRVTGNTDWTLLRAEGVAPEEAQRISVELHVLGHGGWAYFDDATLAFKE